MSLKFHAFWILLALSASFIATPLQAQEYQLVQFLTRAQTLRLLLTAHKDDIENIDYDGKFPDVLRNQWYTNFVLRAVELEVIDAEFSTGLLFPHRSVSRSEFLKMFTTIFDLPKDIPHTLFDVEKGSWYESFAGVAEKYGIFEDTNETGLLKPNFSMRPNEAEHALEALFIRQPNLKSNTWNVKKEIVTIEKQFIATPALVKKAMLKLFRIKTAISPEATKLNTIALVNRQRSRFGLEPLKKNRYLELSAQRHAKDMHQQGYFSHTTPGGASYVDRIRAADYVQIDKNQCRECKEDELSIGAIIDKARTFTTPGSMVSEPEICGCTPRFVMGENIAKGQLTPEQVVEDWMNSEGHRRNILLPQYEELGMGLFGTIWVQNFGRLRME